MMSRPLRIGLFTHSTNPRGGVVHVLELGEALAALGHEVVVHAPDAEGAGFFRQLRIHQALIPAKPVRGGLLDLVHQRVDEYVHYLRYRREEFDIYHAHDGISASALATLVDAGRIRGFVRTVHHLDDFTDPALRATQDRSVTSAAMHLCVSRMWSKRLNKTYGINARVVPNGVNALRFTPQHQPQDLTVRKNIFGSLDGPTFLCVGGIERRKNTINAVRALLAAGGSLPPTARVVIVGGASLLNHGEYQREFDAMMREAGMPAQVRVVGPVADSAMPAIYRSSDALLFPSIIEGFGLAVLEAMACGVPVITSRIAPFTEYLTDTDALLVDPTDVNALAKAMVVSQRPSIRAALIAAGRNVAAAHGWNRSASIHLQHYYKFCSSQGTRHARDAIQHSVA